MSDKARRVPARLQDLREAIANVRSDIGLMGKDDFLVDGKTQRAVIESLIVIGEAANIIMRLDPALEARTPDAWQNLRENHRVRVLDGTFAKRLRAQAGTCLLYTSPSPRDRTRSRMPSSA